MVGNFAGLYVGLLCKQQVPVVVSLDLRTNRQAVAKNLFWHFRELFYPSAPFHQALFRLEGLMRLHGNDLEQ